MQSWLGIGCFSQNLLWGLWLSERTLLYLWLWQRTADSLLAILAALLSAYKSSSTRDNAASSQEALPSYISLIVDISPVSIYQGTRRGYWSFLHALTHAAAPWSLTLIHPPQAHTLSHARTHSRRQPLPCLLCPNRFPLALQCHAILNYFPEPGRNGLSSKASVLLLLLWCLCWYFWGQLIQTSSR